MADERDFAAEFRRMVVRGQNQYGQVVLTFNPDKLLDWGDDAAAEIRRLRSEVAQHAHVYRVHEGILRDEVRRLEARVAELKHELVAVVSHLDPRAITSGSDAGFAYRRAIDLIGRGEGGEHGG